VLRVLLVAGEAPADGEHHRPEPGDQLGEGVGVAVGEERGEQLAVGPGVARGPDGGPAGAGHGRRQPGMRPGAGRPGPPRAGPPLFGSGPGDPSASRVIFPDSRSRGNGNPRRGETGAHTSARSSTPGATRSGFDLGPTTATPGVGSGVAEHRSPIRVMGASCVAAAVTSPFGGREFNPCGRFTSVPTP